MALPDKYQENYPLELFKYMSAGMTDVEVFSKWDISKATFYRWLKDLPELGEAHEAGKAKYEAWIDGKGRDGIELGGELGFKYWKEMAKYKLGRSDKQVASNTNIHIDNMNVLNQQTNDELLAYIRDQLEQSPELQNIIDVTSE